MFLKIIYRIVIILGKNVVHQLGVTLEEMYSGSTRKLGLQKNVICEKCDGKLWHNIKVACKCKQMFSNCLWADKAKCSSYIKN